MGSIAERASGDLVLERLRSALRVDWKEYVALVAERTDGRPFAVLAAIVLSQNTNDKNSIRAYERLRAMVGLKPEDVVNADFHLLEDAIRPAGLSRQKARTLKELAMKVIEWGGEEYLLREDPNVLREKLLSVPGVGPKTADVFLSLVRKAPGVFAVDTHAARIARRWGLVRDKAGYEETSRALLQFFGEGRSEEAHRLLIALGRTYCRARNPLCSECPVKDLCPSAQLQS
ncbi:MAG: endonuclease III [Desulfurococcales archaeon]|nr:endonuclease III [Desulfurococcales archaeon]